MSFNKKTIEDIQVNGKRVLVRCDFNVPLKAGVITDENRITAALPTIKKLIDEGARVILCSHMGKPKGEVKPELSLAPVAKRLSELLGKEVVFAKDDNVVGENAKAAVAAMQNGDVVLLENTRYRKEDSKYEENFSKELASLADVFVNDAVGTSHRAHCSTVGVTKFVQESAVGYLMEKEIAFLGNAVNNPERPFVAILGGSKVSDKINVINNLLEKVDTLIIGGGKAAYYLAKQLISRGIKVKIIENSFERCEELSILLPDAVIINGDGTEQALLKEEGIETCQSFVPLTGIDEENIMLTLYAKQVSNAKVITKLNRITFTNVINSLDLGSVISPKYITSEAIIAYVRAKKNSMNCNIETLYHMYDSRVEAIEFFVSENSNVTDIPLRDLKLKKHLLICFINRNGKIIIPTGNDSIQKNDTVMIITTHTGFTNLQDIME